MDALHWAVLKKRHDWIDLFLQNGADINSQTSSGKTPLMMAIEQNDLDTVLLLLDWNPRLDILDVDGHDALFYASSTNHLMSANELHRGALSVLV